MHLAYIWIVSHLSAKNYRNLWKFDEVLTKTNLLSFFGTRCRSKIGDFAPTRSLLSKISGTIKGVAPPIIFARLVRPVNAYTTLLLTVFIQKNFVAYFLQAKCDLHENRPFCVFGTLFGGLRGNVRGPTIGSTLRPI